MSEHPRVTFNDGWRQVSVDSSRVIFLLVSDVGAEGVNAAVLRFKKRSDVVPVSFRLGVGAVPVAVSAVAAFRWWWLCVFFFFFRCMLSRVLLLLLFVVRRLFVVAPVLPRVFDDGPYRCAKRRQSRLGLCPEIVPPWAGGVDFAEVTVGAVGSVCGVLLPSYHARASGAISGAVARPPPSAY